MGSALGSAYGGVGVVILSCLALALGPAHPKNAHAIIANSAVLALPVVTIIVGSSSERSRALKRINQRNRVAL